MKLQPESEKSLSAGRVSDFTENVAMNLYRTICMISLQMVKVRVSAVHRLIPYSLRLLSNGLNSERAYIRTAQEWDGGGCKYYWMKNSENGNKFEIGNVTVSGMIHEIIEKGTIVFIGSGNENEPLIIEDNRIKCLVGTPGEIHIPLYNRKTVIGILSFDTIHRCLQNVFRIVHPLRIATILIANLLEWVSEQGRSYEKMSGKHSIHGRIDSGLEIDLLKNDIRLKNKLLSTVSHELRTPLTGIISLTQAMRMQEISLSEQEKKTFLGIIENEGKRLALLIKELMEFSVTETEESELTLSEFGLHDLVKEVSALVGGISYSENIVIDISDTIRLYADKNRIKQVIIILLDNAIKYGRTPCKIAVTKKDRHLIVSVADNGNGIVPDEQKKIFDSFYRTASHGKSKPEGAGLGLAIAKKIIESHGGTIWVESVPGQGSTFFFSLSAN